MDRTVLEERRVCVCSHQVNGSSLPAFQVLGTLRWIAAALKGTIGFVVLGLVKQISQYKCLLDHVSHRRKEGKGDRERQGGEHAYPCQ